MYVALQNIRKCYLAALLGVLATGLPAIQAGGQTSRRPVLAPPANQLRPSSSGIRSTASNSRVRPASHRVVTEDEIVAGGTYLEDPDTGQLYATDGNLLPGRSGTATMTPASNPNSRPNTRTPEEEHIEYGEYLEYDGHEPFMEYGGYVEYGESMASCGTSSCDSLVLTPCTLFPAGNLEVSAGVQGFTGPRNRGGSGSFGFHQSVNWAVPFPAFACMGGQVGYRATQSNLSGAEFPNSTTLLDGGVTAGSRQQSFLTAGLFRRVDMGVQGGVVVDFMSDDWYDTSDLVNLRGEISWVMDGVHDLGFWFTAGTGSTEILNEASAPEEWEPTDLYAFFYRRQFGGCREGEARLSAGWTGHGDGLIGIDARLPISPDWAVETNFAYLIPSEGTGGGFTGGHAQESWNLGISLVWYPGRLFGQGDYYYRPLFRVADNGTFKVRRTN